MEVKKIATDPDLLAAYASVLMSNKYSQRVLNAVKNNDRTKFDTICGQAEIPQSAWDELWGLAIGSLTNEAMTAAGTTPTGW